MKLPIRLPVFVVVGWLGGHLLAADITVFAAASLTEALQEIGAAYETKAGDKVVFNFAASGLLARQIEAGAPADIFFPADEVKMDELDHKNLLVKDSSRSLLSNQLVIVAAADSGLALAAPGELTKPGLARVAIGDPASVPAGSYAKEYLGKLGLWTAVEKKSVPCDSVRAVLAAVESGNVEVGIVYQTDAAISKKVKTVFTVAAADGPKICYPTALLKTAPQAAAAAKFLTYLASRDASAVFVRRGFILLPPATGK